MTQPKVPQKKAEVEERSQRVIVSPHEISGRLKSTAGEAEVILVWNVSEQGLCVWTATKLARGEMVIFEMERPWKLTMRGEVRWCRSIPDRSGFLVGLLALDHQEELAKLHGSLGGKSALAI